MPGIAGAMLLSASWRRTDSGVLAVPGRPIGGKESAQLRRPRPRSAMSGQRRFRPSICASSRSASSAIARCPAPMIRGRCGSTDVAPRDKTDDPAIRMKFNLEPSTQEVLAGLVERVAFHNAENGFCVLRAKARDHRDLVTVVGHAAIISAGEWITASCRPKILR